MIKLNDKENYGVLDCTYFDSGTNCQNFKITNINIEHLNRCSIQINLD